MSKKYAFDSNNDEDLVSLLSKPHGKVSKKTVQPATAMQPLGAKSESPAESPLDAFWRDFEPRNEVCFCFRKPDERSIRHPLNTLASFASYRIHVELCLLNRKKTSSPKHQSKSLCITAESEVVEFVHRPYGANVDDAATRWDFVWVRLDNRQTEQLRKTVYDIMTDKRGFSNWNIYCFHLFALPCFSESTSRTCTEMTMSIIKSLWPNEYMGNPFAYTPDAVYLFLNDHDAIVKMPELRNKMPRSVSFR